MSFTSMEVSTGLRTNCDNHSSWLVLVLVDNDEEDDHVHVSVFTGRINIVDLQQVSVMRLQLRSHHGTTKENSSVNSLLLLADHQR